MVEQNRKILFILDKWCAGEKKFGPSEWETNLWQSFASLNVGNFKTFHFDEYFDQFGEAGDKALLETIASYQPSLICLVLYRLPGTAQNVPTFQTLKIIKKNYQIPIFCIWGDLEIGEQVRIAEKLEPYVNFNIFTALSSVFYRLKNKDKYAYFWVPKDSKFFYDSGDTRDIDISYLGSPKPDRLRKIKYLERHGLKVFYSGGERQVHLSTADFGNILRRSKISLSFARAWYSHVTNARAFEVTLSGSLLMEQESLETAKLFVPFIDYVPYFSSRDLCEKCVYYLKHEEERSRIAAKGYQKAKQYYSSERFWNLVFQKAETLKQTLVPSGSYVLDNNDQDILNNWGAKTLELDFSKLKYLSKFTSLRYWLLENVYRSNFLHNCYIIFCQLTDWRNIRFKVLVFIYRKIKLIIPKKLFIFLERNKKKFFV